MQGDVADRLPFFMTFAGDDQCISGLQESDALGDRLAPVADLTRTGSGGKDGGSFTWDIAANTKAYILRAARMASTVRTSQKASWSLASR